MLGSRSRLLMGGALAALVGTLGAPAVGKPDKAAVCADGCRSDALVAELRTQVPSLLDEYRVPGAAVAIIRNGKLEMAQGFGVVARGGPKVTARTPFDVASTSKPVSAWGIMRLVEEKQIALDRPANAQLSGWTIPAATENAGDPTVAQILSHTGGLSVPGFIGWVEGKPRPSLIAALNGENSAFYLPDRHVARVAPSGAAVSYSGGGYTVLQLLAEQKAGMPFAEFMQRKVLDPLGMTDSAYTRSAASVRSMALPHDAAGRPVGRRMFVEAAAAGMSTTVVDMSRWLGATLSGLRGHDTAVLKAETIEQMARPAKLADGSEGGWGLGYQVLPTNRGPAVAHGGTNLGYRAYFVGMPASGDGVVVLTNGEAGDGVVRAVTCLWAKSRGIEIGGQEGAQICTRDAASRLRGTYRAEGAAAMLAELARMRAGSEWAGSVTDTTVPAVLQLAQLETVAARQAEQAEPYPRFADDRIELLNANAGMFPQSPVAAILLVQAYAEAGRMADAAAEVKRAVAVMPEHPMIQALAQKLSSGAGTTR